MTYHQLEPSGAVQTIALLPRLYERDIDVLIQEELMFNPAVVASFATALGVGSPIRIRECRLSVVDQNGETDIFATFELDGKVGGLLVENKIDASFMPRQPERYRERTELLVGEKQLDLAHCVLMAPKAYVASAGTSVDHFDAVLSYEEIAIAIASEGTPRARHRASLLLRAVEHARSSYTLTPVAEVGNLWRRIYTIASQEYPELKMNAPSEKGGQSKWIIFKANLPAKTTIDWKITKATVELSFWPGSSHIPNEDIDLSAIPGARLDISQRTSVIRLNVPQPPAEWIAIAEDQIRDALSAASLLLKFYNQNSAALARERA